MKFLKTFALFWYDFIVGDDWIIAAGVVLALLATHALARHQINAWWLMLVSAAVLLALSLWREARKTPRS